ncbi:hypothetical protein SMD20_09760 [Nonomuraea sp. LP-02]|uniref:hypothetical protein n=1 Tax=Nonomuraea sp. LP-02 TaxID=3097960 RepID=UPI002E3500EF|nr:hypothetical protein [Nonomuraea sp. LP-02]MED7924518.1 hypothetical protein [Nonomuraea sp. LP-02]
MHITHATVPGIGTVHHLDTQEGDRLAVIVSRTGQHSLVLYDRADPDTPAHTVELDQQEADQLADLLHSRPLTDRLSEIERRLASLVPEARP